MADERGEKFTVLKEEGNHVPVSKFLHKPSCEGSTKYNPMSCLWHSLPMTDHYMEIQKTENKMCMLSQLKPNAQQYCHAQGGILTWRCSAIIPQEGSSFAPLATEPNAHAKCLSKWFLSYWASDKSISWVKLTCLTFRLHRAIVDLECQVRVPFFWP